MAKDYGAASLALHRELRGKVEMVCRYAVDTDEALSVAYTPGVAEPCLAIQRDPTLSFELTRRWNTVAVVTDGTAVLGLGDIGPEAGMPVMEGKCVLFKSFGGVDAVPLCIRSKDPHEIVRTVELLAGSFGGINLEDIAAPRCFEIERRLKASLDIPVFHDDQWGTAVVSLAGLQNALAVVGKKLSEVRIVCSGAGAAGTSIARLLVACGAHDVVVCDRAGAIHQGRENLTPAKAKLARLTNPHGRTGTLADVLRGADVFCGVSAPGLVTSEMVESMAEEAVVFACANPTPEISEAEARSAGAAVVATGRSDSTNQVNNVLCFPGLFRGALDARAADITQNMLLAASKAIAGVVGTPTAERILPRAHDARVHEAVACAVADAARSEGVARA